MIDYRIWNFDGTGKNISTLLTKKEKDIWSAAFPYQDKREDTGQGETVVYFALNLLESIDGNRDVVVPAAILHDIGWHIISNLEFREALRKGKDYSLRVKHQEEGSRLAKDILSKIKYPEGTIAKICNIISNHDTREKRPSIDGKIMMDSDVLWRFTAQHRNSYLMDKGPRDLFKKLNQLLTDPHELYHTKSLELARLEIANTMFWLYPMQSRESTRKNFTREIEKVKNFYSR